MKHSLRTKTVLLIVMIAVLIGGAGIVTSNRFITRIVEENYKDKASDLVGTVAVVIDANEVAALQDSVLAIYDAAPEYVSSEEWGSAAFDEYVALFSGVEETEAFLRLRGVLRDIQSANDVDCLYLMAIDTQNARAIYLVDSAYEDACPPGCFDPVYEENHEVLSDPERGFPPYITDTELYGKLVTAGAPVHDENGALVCYIMADVSMDMILAQQNRFIYSFSGLLALLTILICAAAIWLVNLSIIRPINQISHAVSRYGAGMENVSSSEMDALTIRTQDEIESLYLSIKKMLGDINGYIDNLMETTKELKQTRTQANEMNELANRDALTGAGSKFAYERMVGVLTKKMEQRTARYGIVMVDMNFLKRLNDTYGHEKGDIALRNICGRVCGVFVHSPVYRYGGDEFVIVVEDRDYDDVEALTQTLNESMTQTEGEPWERVTAAVGYALYDSAQDDSVEDVFRRADQIMYAHKKAMKAARLA